MARIFHQKKMLNYTLALFSLFLLRASLEGALENSVDSLTQFYGLQNPLYFTSLVGGTVNAPIYLYTVDQDHEVPLGVFKKEIVDKSFAIHRWNFLDQMKEKGFIHLPTIIKNVHGDYLTEIDGEYYCCCEYLLSDPSIEKRKVSFSLLVELIGRFHAFSREIPKSESLSLGRLENFQELIPLFSDEVLIDTDLSLFDTPIWSKITQLGRYFASEKFEAIYQSLPKQLIHGDAHPGNIILRNQIPYFVDFDLMSYEIRLWDYASAIIFDFHDDYLEMLQDQSLFPLLDAQLEKSGVPLTTLEKQHFSLIVAFRQLEVISWNLRMMKEGLYLENLDQYERYKKHLQKRILTLERLFLIESDKNLSLDFCNELFTHDSSEWPLNPV